MNVSPIIHSILPSLASYLWRCQVIVFPACLPISFLPHALLINRYTMYVLVLLSDWAYYSICSLIKIIPPFPYCLRILLWCHARSLYCSSSTPYSSSLREREREREKTHNPCFLPGITERNEVGASKVGCWWFWHKKEATGFFYLRRYDERSKNYQRCCCCDIFLTFSFFGRF